MDLRAIFPPGLLGENFCPQTATTPVSCRQFQLWANVPKHELPLVTKAPSHRHAQATIDNVPHTHAAKSDGQISPRPRGPPGQQAQLPWHAGKPSAPHPSLGFVKLPLERHVRQGGGTTYELQHTVP